MIDWKSPHHARHHRVPLRRHGRPVRARQGMGTDGEWVCVEGPSKTVARAVK